MKIAAIIPARAGSKRLPGKNTRCFCGKPLIEVTVDQALESCVFNGGVFVSTDIESIINDYKGGVIIRPACLADDRATSEDVVLHALWSLPELPDAFVLLQPTSPLRRREDFIKISEMFNAGSEHIISYSDKYRNGAFYAMTSNRFNDNRDLRYANHEKLAMPDWTGKYIDTEEDFVECEGLYREHLLDRNAV